MPLNEGIHTIRITVNTFDKDCGTPARGDDHFATSEQLFSSEACIMVQNHNIDNCANTKQQHQEWQHEQDCEALVYGELLAKSPPIPGILQYVQLTWTGRRMARTSRVVRCHRQGQEFTTRNHRTWHLVFELWYLGECQHRRDETLPGNRNLTRNIARFAANFFGISSKLTAIVYFALSVRSKVRWIEIKALVLTIIIDVKQISWLWHFISIGYKPETTLQEESTEN